jgi:hypothetical protein
MKKLLKRIELGVWHFKDGLYVEGAPEGVSGDLSDVLGNLTGVSGDVSNVRGFVTNLQGDVSNVRGDVTKVRGDVTRVSGDLDSCGITPEDREKGVKIEDLIDSN